MELCPYKVVLRSRNNQNKEFYFLAEKEKIERIFHSCKFKNKEGYTEIGMAHIAGNNLKKREPEDILRFNLGDLDSLVLTAQNKRTAKKCLSYWNIAYPFNKKSS